MTRPIILHLDGVTKQYTQAALPAVASVSLTLHQGDILGLLGPSGCGKTTLLRLIAGFEGLQAGTIALGGKTVASVTNSLPPEQRDIGMVFQDYALFPHLTVAKNVAFGLKHQGKNSKDNTHNSVAAALALVGLEGLENRYPHELSGGQQQRVALARALAPRPAIILLDEPLSNLDVQVRLRLRQEVRDILKATETSGVFVTHDREEALSISDWVAVMRQGRLEQFGTPEEVYQKPASRFVGEFVTQANFISGLLEEDIWKTELGCFAVKQYSSLQVPSHVSPHGELMIRQEDLSLSGDEDSGIVICDRQFLGKENRYCLQTPSGQKLYVITTTRNVFPIGAKVRVSCGDDSPLVFFPDLPRL